MIGQQKSEGDERGCDATKQKHLSNRHAYNIKSTQQSMTNILSPNINKSHRQNKQQQTYLNNKTTTNHNKHI